MIRQFVIDGVKKLWKEKGFLTLYSALGIEFALSLLLSVGSANILGAESFGDYSWLRASFNIFIPIVSFGIPYTVAYYLAHLEEGESPSKMYAAFLMFNILQSVVLFLLIACYGIVQYFMGNPLSFWVIACGILPIGNFLNQSLYGVFTAERKISYACIVRVGGKVLFAIGILALWAGCNFRHFTSSQLLFFFIIGYYGMDLLVESFLLFRMPYDFRDIRPLFKKIWSKNWGIGFHIYSASVFNMICAGLTPLFISFFSINNITTGYYTMALSLCAPLAIAPNGLIALYFKDFAAQSNISSKQKKIVVLAFCLFFGGYAVCIYPFIRFLYPPDFIIVVPLSICISFSYFLIGLGDLMSRFLFAHAICKPLRNTAFAVGAITLGGNLTVIHLWGMWGGALIKNVAGLVYFLILYFAYRRFIKQGGDNKQVGDNHQPCH